MRQFVRFSIFALAVVFIFFIFAGIALGKTEAWATQPTDSTTTLVVCTDATWMEPSTGMPAVIQADGPLPGSMHDLPLALPIWGQHDDPGSETTLTKVFSLPPAAKNITAIAEMVADDGVVLFINAQEAGSFDAMAWPPPTKVTVENLRPGDNTIQADVYNRPTLAWLEACLTVTYQVSTDIDAFLPVVVNGERSIPPTSTPVATQTPAITTTPSPTPGGTPMPTRPPMTNLLIGNMPLPTGWQADGRTTYWEGYLRIQDEPTIQLIIYDCGDNSANNRLDILQVYDPDDKLVVDKPNCSGDPTIDILTAGKPGLYRVFMQDNDTTNGNGGNIWVNRLRDQRIYLDPLSSSLAATNLLLDIEPLPMGWKTGGRLTFWEGYINVQNETTIEVRVGDCGDNEGDGKLDAIQITDPTGLIVGASSGCSSSSKTFAINTQDKPGYYRIYFLDKDTGPVRAVEVNGGSLAVTNLQDQHVYPSIPNGPPPTPPPPTKWDSVGPGSASGGGISNNTGASQQVAITAGANDAIYVAWSDTSTGDAEIYLRQWNGSSWVELGGSATGGGISNNTSESLWPALAIGSDGLPWVAWQDGSAAASEIYVRKWNGTSWATVGAGSASGDGISATSGRSDFVDLQIAANGQAYATWVEDNAGNDEIYLRSWDGTAWRELDSSASGGGLSISAGRSGRPSLALEGSGLPMIAWSDDSGGNQEIYVRRYDGSGWAQVGANSASDGGISNTAGKSLYPSLDIAASGTPYVAWYDNTSGVRQIYVATWTGTQWVPAGDDNGLSDTNGDSQEPSLAIAASDTPVVVWQETTAHDEEVYIRRWVLNGWVEVGNGSASGGGISNNDGDSNFPVLTVAPDGRLFVAWEDNSNGNYEIYVLASSALD